LITQQLTLDLGLEPSADLESITTKQEINDALEEADYIICAYSGGKDSTAIVLDVIERGFKDKIQLHHNLVDGIDDHFFDWKVTKSYCEKFAQHMNLPLYFSYREGGMRKEICKENARTAPMFFQYIKDNSWGKSGGIKGSINTQRQFPQISKNMSTRWCSSLLKISPMNSFIANQPEFDHKKLVVITGERGEEHESRAKYNQIQAHTTNCNKRSVTHIRPILYWKEQKVWNVMQRWGIVPHASYWLSFGRCSCRACIFLADKDLTKLQVCDSAIIDEIADYEIDFKKTIAYDSKRTKYGQPQLTVKDRAALHPAPKLDEKWIAIAKSETWDIPIYVDPKDWVLPPGAYKKTGGSP